MRNDYHAESARKHNVSGRSLWLCPAIAISMPVRESTGHYTLRLLHTQASLEKGAPIYRLICLCSTTAIRQGVCQGGEKRMRLDRTV
jgi:hypothetical protein